VAYGANLVPMIFLHRADSTRFYRLFSNKTVKWIPVLLGDIQSMLVKGEFMGAEEFKNLAKVTEETSAKFVQKPDAVADLTGAGFKM